MLNPKAFLHARSSIWHQFAAIIILNLFAGFALAGHFLATGTLCYDNMDLYSLFRNSLHALNHFGEIQWWDPSVQVGFPSYYLAILGHNGGTPLFAATGSAVWLLGRLGVHFASYSGFYVVYFGFIVPLLFSIAFWLLIRQVLADNRAVLFGIVLASFSPGVVFNLSDAPFESAIYSVFFAAAFLHLVRNPGRRAFRLLCLSAMVLAASLNHFFLFWNLFFVPLFCATALSFGTEPFTAAARKVLRAVPPSRWLAAMALIALCALPSLLVYAQGGDFVRTNVWNETYSFGQLRPGNPLEALAVSTPGIGFIWTTDGKTMATVGDPSQERWMPFPIDGKYKSYGYMGILSLPFIFTGLVFGQPAWRKRLLVLIAGMGGVVILSGYSPIFSAILAFPSPLRSVNHFSDCTFRMGIFFLLILAAGLGMEALLAGRKWVRRRFPWIFWSCTVFAVGLFSLVFFRTPRTAPPLAPLNILGFTALMVFLIAAVVQWTGRTAVPAARSRLVTALTVLTLIDISTVAFWHVRNTMWDRSPSFRDPDVEMVGMASNDERTNTVKSLLIMRGTMDLVDRGFAPMAFPLVAWAQSARAASGAEAVPPSKGRELEFLALPERFAANPRYGRFFLPGRQEAAEVEFLSARQTYNTLSLEVSADSDALVFWRDAHSPFWTARVNGDPVEIAPAFGLFKAVPVPSGRSQVVFRFRPGLVGPAILVSYLAIALMSAAVVVSGIGKALAPGVEPDPVGRV